VLRGVSCDACKACLTSKVLLSANVFIYFKEYSDTEQSLAYPSEKIVKTVGTAITLIQCMMTGGPLDLCGAAFHSCHYE
jgi:hypothetical protein